MCLLIWLSLHLLYCCSFPFLSHLCLFIFSSFHNFFWIFLDSIFIIPFHCCLIICISVLFFVINQALQHTSFFFFLMFIYSRIWLHWVLVAAHGLSRLTACGIFLHQGLNPCPCIAKQILNPWATGKSQQHTSLNSQSVFQ